MRKIFFIACCFSVLAFVGCAEDYDLEENFTLQELPAYVAFNPPGTQVNLPPVDTAEDAGTEEIGVEVPGGTVSNVTVNYTLSGDAVFGEDFTIDGATSSGGSLVISLPTTPNLDGQPIGADIVVELLTDGVIDGDKTLEITLTSASNAEGELAIGRGGTDLLRTAVVNIADVDAPEE